MTGAGARRIKVLIVDDSAVVRQVFQKVLSRDPEIEVVGAAPDPFVARDMLLSKQPDVVTLDLEMPRMDGLTFLRKIMAYRPVPVIVVSSLTPRGSAVALDALNLGAVEVLHKPTAAFAAKDLVNTLVSAVKAAVHVRVDKLQQVCGAGEIKPAPSLKTTTNKVLAIGASTGGTVAVEQILRHLPSNIPGTLIVQHMPPGITQSFARRLNEMCPMEVREAKSGDSVVPGLALLAPGNLHMALRRTGGRYWVELVDGPPINYHRPSIDLTFKSVARVAGENAVGVILTGMGKDGAQGLLEMRKAGARTLAQDEASCVVYGMPKVAAEIGAPETVLPLGELSSAIIGRLSSPSMAVTGGFKANGVAA